MSREIVAVYTLDDVSIEMVISLPENYPLGTISVHSDQRKGISCNISKKWLLQLNIFLQHQVSCVLGQKGLFIFLSSFDTDKVTK